MTFSRLGVLAATVLAAATIVGGGTASAVHPPLTITPFLWNRYSDNCVTNLGNGGAELRECQWESDLFTSMIPSQRWGELKAGDSQRPGDRIVRIHNGNGQCLTSAYNGAGAPVNLTPCSNSVRQVWLVQPLIADAPFKDAIICTGDSQDHNLCLGSLDRRNLSTGYFAQFPYGALNWDLG